jgi:hypothetical protein
MLAKSPGDRQQTPLDLVDELSEIVDELALSLPYAAATLPRASAVRSQRRWQRHAIWAIPTAALLGLGLAVDRLSRDGRDMAPFAELRIQSEAERTSTEPIAPSDRINGGAGPSSIESNYPPAADTLPRMTDPLPLQSDGRPGGSLWDSVSNWPTGPSAVEPLAPLSDPFRAVDNQSEAAIWPSPTIRLDLHNGSAGEASTPTEP